ncbi:expressed unknown protein [Seminavis robusta]|uniref:Uncharacterized protein n=1 Tax=Seminavis robusta TaxID=568900 RepID=A0A9N8DI66_9STRA|nr:expressed unknown protein [Seminavis robusta]|eukprot:Sro171_g075700.1 n/a (489) ;mRNA; r:19978-21444
MDSSNKQEDTATSTEQDVNHQDGRADPAAYLNEECMALVFAFAGAFGKAPTECICHLLPEKTDSDGVNEEKSDQQQVGRDQTKDNNDTESTEDTQQDMETQSNDDDDDESGGDEGNENGTSYGNHDDSDDDSQDDSSHGSDSDSDSQVHPEAREDFSSDDGSQDDDEDGVDKDFHFGVSTSYAARFYNGLARVSRRWKRVLDACFATTLVPSLRLALDDLPKCLAQFHGEWLADHQVRFKTITCHELDWEDYAAAYIDAVATSDLSVLKGVETSLSVTDLVDSSNDQARLKRAFLMKITEQPLPELKNLGLDLHLDQNAGLTSKDCLSQLPLFSWLVHHHDFQAGNTHGAEWHRDRGYVEFLHGFDSLPNLANLFLTCESSYNGPAIRIACNSLKNLRVAGFLFTSTPVELSLDCPSLECYECDGYFSLQRGGALCTKQKVIKADNVPEDCRTLIHILTGPDQSYPGMIGRFHQVFPLPHVLNQDEQD